MRVEIRNLFIGGDLGMFRRFSFLCGAAGILPIPAAYFLSFRLEVVHTVAYRLF